MKTENRKTELLIGGDFTDSELDELREVLKDHNIEKCRIELDHENKEK